MKNKTLLFLLLFFIGGIFISSSQAMLPMCPEKGKSVEGKTAEEQKEQREREDIEEQRRRISGTDSNDDDHDSSSTVQRGNVVEAREKEESEVEDVSNLDVLEQRLEEARAVVNHLQRKGPAINQTILQQLAEKWSERSERYQQALATLLEQNNNAGPIEQQLNEPRLEKLGELVEASEKAVKALAKALGNASKNKRWNSYLNNTFSYEKFLDGLRAIKVNRRATDHSSFQIIGRTHHDDDCQERRME